MCILIPMPLKSVQMVISCSCCNSPSWKGRQANGLWQPWMTLFTNVYTLYQLTGTNDLTMSWEITIYMIYIKILMQLLIHALKLILAPHICVMHWDSIGSGNDLSPIRRQAITWTNADLLSVGALGTIFSEIWIEILTFSLNKNAFESVVCEMVAILSRGDGFTSIAVYLNHRWILSQQEWLHPNKSMRCNQLYRP